MFYHVLTTSGLDAAARHPEAPPGLGRPYDVVVFGATGFTGRAVQRTIEKTHRYGGKCSIHR